MGYEVIWTVFPNNLHLPIRKIDNQIRTEAFPVKHCRRILPDCGDQRRSDLIKAVVPLTPKCGSPRIIQDLDRAILFAKPFLELPLAGIAHAQIPVRIAKFIVNLPANDARIVRKPFGKSGHKSANMRAVYKIGLAIVVPASKMPSPALSVNWLYLWIFLNNPRWRRRRRRTEN